MISRELEIAQELYDENPDVVRVKVEKVSETVYAVECERVPGGVEAYFHIMPPVLPR